jgi:ABC-type transport system substrate-binding protein
MRPFSLIALLAVLAGVASSCSLFDSRPVFRYRSGPVQTLDPAAAADHVSVREAARAYHTPMRLERSMGNVVSRPWILVKAPTLSDTGRRWELEFRPGVMFQENRIFEKRSRELTACDWVKSILRHGDPRVGSRWLSYLSSRITGFREWSSGAATTGDSAYSSFPRGLSCSGLKATVTLQSPDPEFVFFLGHPAASVLPVDEILAKKWNPGDQPVGSGTFVFSGSRTGTIRWKSADPISPLRALEVDTSRDGFRDWDLLLRGSLDLIELPRDLQSSILGPDGELAEKWRDQGLQLQKIQRADLVFIGFQMKDPILGAKRGVRQALAKALAGRFVSEKVFAGRAMDAYSAIPPGMAGYFAGDPRIPRTGDLAPAQDLLGFNGHPHGRGLPEFRLACLSHPVEQELCRAIAARWELLGVRTSLVTMGDAERRAGILDGTVHFWPVTWVADLPGPVTHLENFDPARGLPEIPAPLGALAAYRRALATAKQAAPARRSIAIAEASAILNREVPAAFLVHRFQYWLVRPGVVGLNWQDFAWHDTDELRKLDSGSK